MSLFRSDTSRYWPCYRADSGTSYRPDTVSEKISYHPYGKHLSIRCRADRSRPYRQKVLLARYRPDSKIYQPGSGLGQVPDGAGRPSGSACATVSSWPRLYICRAELAPRLRQPRLLHPARLLHAALRLQGRPTSRAETETRLSSRLYSGAVAAVVAAASAIGPESRPPMGRHLDASPFE